MTPGELQEAAVRYALEAFDRACEGADSLKEWRAMVEASLHERMAQLAQAAAPDLYLAVVHYDTVAQRNRSQVALRSLVSAIEAWRDASAYACIGGGGSDEAFALDEAIDDACAALGDPRLYGIKEGRECDAFNTDTGERCEPSRHVWMPGRRKPWE